jgi:hypothetical protein
MPRLSIHGRAAMGIAGVEGSIDTVAIPDSSGPYWLNHAQVVFIQPSINALVAYDVTSGARWQVSGAANDVRAGGDVWAIWLAGVGLQASSGLADPAMGLLDVSRDGAIAHNNRQQDIYGVDVTELSGEIWKLTPNVISDLQLLGDKRAIWREVSRLCTANLPASVQVPGNLWTPRAADLGGEWWVCYFSELYGLILHPFASTIGYVICAPGVSAFNPDVMALSADVMRVAWSATQGEGPGDLRLRDVNVRTEARTEIAGAPPIDIPPINKPCWLGWFEFTPTPAPLPPGNCLLWAGNTVGAVNSQIQRYDGTTFAYYVPGGSVEEIEALVAACPWPAVAYWDARTWPRFPTLRAGDWLALQWYCLIDETPEAFEANMRAVIATVPGSYTIAGVCQCYTSNAGLTTNLAGLVPVFARLARDYPQVTMLLPFTDQGRATGLCDHPELTSYWQELFSTITGTPAIDDGGGGGGGGGGEVPTFAYDLGPLSDYAGRRWGELDAVGRTNAAVASGASGDDLYNLQSSILVQILGEYHHELGHHEVELFYKNSGTCYSTPNGCASGDVCILRLSSGVWWQDVGIGFGGPSPSLTFQSPFEPSAADDWAKCGPPPIPTAGPEPGPDPEPPPPDDLTARVEALEAQMAALEATLAGGFHANGLVNLPVVLESLTSLRARGDIDVEVKPGQATPPPPLEEGVDGKALWLWLRRHREDEPARRKKPE